MVSMFFFKLAVSTGRDAMKPIYALSINVPTIKVFRQFNNQLPFRAKPIQAIYKNIKNNKTYLQKYCRCRQNRKFFLLPEISNKSEVSTRARKILQPLGLWKTRTFGDLMMTKMTAFFN